MAEFKVVISDPKTGKSYQREAKDEAAKLLIGKNEIFFWNKSKRSMETGTKEGANKRLYAVPY